MTVIFFSPQDVSIILSKALREKRLTQNLSQQSLAERSGVSLGVLKKFERTGKISLESLLKLAVILGELGKFAELFKSSSADSFLTIDDLLKKQTRKRGRGQ